jgi:hypothetical protein
MPPIQVSRLSPAFSTKQHGFAMFQPDPSVTVIYSAFHKTSRAARFDSDWWLARNPNRILYRAILFKMRI